jgi:hypothetical protein
MRHSKTEDIFIRMSSYYFLPTIHSLDSYALLFQLIVALLSMLVIGKADFMGEIQLKSRRDRPWMNNYDIRTCRHIN